MPPTATYDRRALAGLLARQYGVIARGQVLACGISPSVLRHRTREGGPWRIVLPGVYLTHWNGHRRPARHGRIAVWRSA